MKKVLFLVLWFILITNFAFAEDRVRVQVQFKKGIFECPQGDEIVDWNVGGGNTYEHTCKDGTWLNSFKEYNGNLSYTPEEYKIILAENIIASKQKLVDDWLYQVRNPPPYIEPTLEDLQNMYNSKMDEATEYLEQISKKTTEIELEKNKTEGKDKIDQVK